MPPGCKGKFATERNARVMTSLVSTLMEKDVMEAGCVMRSVADVLFTHLREQKNENIPVRSAEQGVLNGETSAINLWHFVDVQ